MKVDNTLRIISMISEKSSKFIINELEKSGIVGLVPSHGNILLTLYNDKELSMTEIANKVGKDRSTITTLVKKLINLEYAATKINPEDSRSTLVYLTNKGENIKDEFIRISELIYETQYKGINEEEVKILRNILTKMNNNFESN